MLVQFSFHNFKGFKDETIVNFVASSSNKDYYAYKTEQGYSVLKALAFYGANGSGKSGLFEAFAFMRCVICPPKRGQTLPVFEYWQTKYDPFRLNTYSSNEESSFEMIFILDGIQYRYGFSLERSRILSEWLYRKQCREIRIFFREGLEISVNSRYVNGKMFKVISSAGMISEVVLLLSVMATFNDPLCHSIVRWFERMTIISGIDKKQTQLNIKEHKDSILAFLKALDINIEDIEFKNVEEGTRSSPWDKCFSEISGVGDDFYDRIHTVHKVYDPGYNWVGTSKFSLENDESSGTYRLMAMVWPIMNSLKTGTLIVINEFDSDIHLLVLKVIISLFYKTQSGAQLVINLHNTSLLNQEDEEGSRLFIKDQIFMVNKNRYGESALKPITNYNCKLRDNIEGYYLNGQLSGVPIIDEEQLLEVIGIGLK